MKGKFQLFMNFVTKVRYSYYLKNYDIDDRAIFLESNQGKRINGNIFYILKELSTNEIYKKYKIYLCCNESNKEKFITVLHKYGFSNIEFVVFGTTDYMRKLATSKYLFNDNVFDTFFMKRKGQVYTNIWHGTPLSAIGKSTQNGKYNSGNIQKNLVSADYVICPSMYAKQKLEEEFMLENIAPGKILLSALPKTVALNDEHRATEIRQDLELENKRVYAYFPVRRGKNGQAENKSDLYLLYYLYELDKMLSDDEVLYVKLNATVAKNINFKECSHIKRYPSQYEPYDFLSCVDCLITDYSNVVFDYATTSKKCVLFTFDEDVYYDEHKTYLSLDEFPFCRARTIDKLIDELRSTKNYDDSEFIREYSAQNSKSTNEDILNHIILCKQSNPLKEIYFNKNEKKNVIVYIEGEGKANVSVVKDFFEKADLSKHNYYLSFNIDNGKKYKDIINNLPDGVNCFSVTGTMNLGLCKKVLWKLFLSGFFPVRLFNKIFEDVLKNENRRIFGNACFDRVVHLNGVGLKMLLVFSEFDCEKHIYICDNKICKNKSYKKRLKYICSKYDRII